MDEALCAKFVPKRSEGGNVEEDPWFPDRGQFDLATDAKKICMRCPVFYQCEDYKLRTDPEYGIWAADLQTRNKNAAEESQR